jgi:hypothetical protein
MDGLMPLDHPIASRGFDDELCAKYLLLWRVGIAGPICLLGTVGNSICIVLFHASPELGGSLTPLLKALAWADVIHLVTYILVIVWPDFMMYFCSDVRVDFVVYFYAYLWPIAAISLACDTWYIVLISLHRYRAVCQPLKSSEYSNPERMRKQIIIATLVAVVLLFPRFFEMIVIEPSPGSNDTRLSHGYSDMYYNFYYQLIYKTLIVTSYRIYIPMIIISVSSFCIICTLRKSDQTLGRPRTFSGSSSIRKVSRVPLTIMITFVLTQLPVCIYPIARLILESDKLMKCTVYYFYVTAADVVSLVNPAINCLFYFLFWKNFRRKFLGCCCVCFRCKTPAKKSGMAVLSENSVMTEVVMKCNANADAATNFSANADTATNNSANADTATKNSVNADTVTTKL